MPRVSYISHIADQVAKTEATEYTSRIAYVFPWLVPGIVQPWVAWDYKQSISMQTKDVA